MINLSKPQKLIYDMEKFSGGAIAVICGCMLTSTQKDITEVKHAINEIYRLNDALRIRIFEYGGIISQEIAEYCEQDVDVLHFENKSELDAYGETIAKTPIDLSGSLCDMKIAILPDQYGVIIKLHHLVGDAWTVSLICNQLSALLSGEIPEAYSYKDYIAAEQTYISSKRYEKDKAFFLEQFKKCDEATYLSEKQSKTFTSERATYMIDREKTAIINEYARQNNASPFLLFITALSIYMNRIKMNTEKFYVGTAVLNRSNFCEKNTAGMFVNTVPVLIELDNQKSFASNLENISVSMLSVLRHQKFNYDDVLSTIRSEYDFSEKLYDVMLSYQNASVNGTGIETTWYHCGAQTESLQIHIDDRDNESIFRVHYDYLVEKFTKHDIDILHEHICNLLFDAINNDNKMLYDLEMLSSDEKQKLFHDFNDTAVDYPRNKCVHELFEEQVEMTSDNVAVIACDNTLTYRELNEQANRIAHSLIEKGVEVGDIVAFALPRKSYLISTIYGILKAGAAFLPVDLDYPQDRIEYMIQDSHAKIFVTEDMIDGLLDNENSNNPCVKMSCDELCYCIYTSGSTGKPKGTLITHKNASNYCNSSDNNVYHKVIKADYKNIVSIASVGFDMFITESLLSLLNGMTIILANENQTKFQNDFNLLAVKHQVEIMQTTPTKMKLLIGNEAATDFLEHMKVIILGGETVDNLIYEKLSGLTNAAIFNLYGPTEDTVWATIAQMDGKDIHIGKPIANTQIYIVDKYMSVTPIGVTGELCIAGDGVGAGYLNRPELTAEKFIDNPFGNGKLYKTGDLAYWREDGNIVYVGRNDFQVKIRGLRIELGEIENAIQSVDGISQAVVVVRKNSEGRQLICAFYTGNEIGTKEIRGQIGKKLPKYMLPHIFTHLEEMPLTSSGKINRKALPEIDLNKADTTTEYIAPATENEKVLSAAVQEVLGIDKVGTADNFFDLGGDSLKAIELISMLEGQGYHTDTKAIFECDTIGELAASLTDFAEKETPFEFDGDIPTTDAQMRVYTAQSMQDGTTTYNVPYIFETSEPVDVRRLQNAVDLLIDRYEILRTHFENKDGTIIQVIDDNAVCKVEELTDGDTSALIKPFDLTKAPLIRIGVYENIVMIDMHHIITDGSSMHVFMNELNELYMGRTGNKSPVQYKLFAVEKQDHTESEKYWLSVFGDEVPVLEMNTDFKRGQKQSFNGSAVYDTINFELHNEIVNFCKEKNITPFVYYMAAFDILLSRFSGSEDIVVGMPISGRGAKYLNTIGMFVNTVALRNKPIGSKGVTEFLNEVKENSVQAINHQNYPYGELVKKLGIQSNGRNPLFDVMFAYQNELMSEVVFGDKKAALLPIPITTSKYDLTVNIIPRADDVVIVAEYCTDLYKESTIQRLINGYRKILGQMLNIETLKNISALTDEENLKLLHDFNDTAAKYPKNKCVHQLFEEQVERTSDNVAVIACDNTLTYRELNDQANRIAHSLIEKGVKVGDIVAFALPRESYLISAILGIIKAGAAYLPIDPDYPQDRIEYILDDSKAKLFITESMIYELLENKNTMNPHVNMTSDNLCYCIYTSGSTGKPKGALLKHSGIVNLVTNLSIYHDLSECKRFGFMTSITFDVATQEIFTSLINGFTGVLMPERKETRIDEIIGGIVDNKIDVVYATPTYFDSLTGTEYNADKLLSVVKVVCLAGEKFSLNNNVLTLGRKYNVIFENQYGPAETHVITTTTTIDDINNIHIGKPIANVQIYIVDKYMKITSIGVTGELCIAGDGVGAGYLNRPELTAEKFIDNPFGKGKLYKSGDLAYWREDGNIVYVGRNDFQVKIRGLRIELGEIENATQSVDGISQAVVVVRKNSEGRQLICAFYTGNEIGTKEIRGQIGKKLPKYMLPHIFTHLEEMPLTSSGKINRKALPEVDLNKVDTETEYIAPATENEKVLSAAVQEVLGLDKVGTADNFFDLGGDSLKAIELISVLEGHGYHTDTKAIFECDTIGELAASLTDFAEKETLFEFEGDIPATDAQMRVYTAQSMQDGTTTYNVPYIFETSETVDVRRLQNAVDLLIDRYEILRTHFENKDGTIIQVIDDNAVCKVEELTDGDRSAFVKPFDLTKSPLIRVGAYENTVMIDMHHIITDGSSMPVFMSELNELYMGRTGNKSPVQYKQFAVEKQEHTESEKYWLSVFGDEVPVLEMNTDFKRGQKQSFNGGAVYDTINFELHNEIVNFCKEKNITPFVYYMAAFDILLSRFSGSEDIVVGMPISGRGAKYLNTIGMFVNTVALRNKPIGSKGVTEFLNEVKENSVQAINHQNYPYGELVKKLGIQSAGRNPLFDVMFAYQNEMTSEVVFGDKKAALLPIPITMSKYDLTVNIIPRADDVVIVAEYCTDLYKENTVQRLVNGYRRILEQMLNVEILKSISVITDEEKRKLLYDFNDTAVEYAKDKCIHELISEQAAKTPDKIALVFENEHFTYKQLDEMSNSLARCLRQKSIKPNDVVPIIAKRDWRIIVAMLGILKAGGAYMPVDPSYPVERIEYMLETANSKIALSYGYFNKLNVETIDLTDFDFSVDTQNIKKVNSSSDLCYIIFTSGSTGKPKGVALRHSNVTNYCDNNNNNNVCHKIIKSGYESIVSVTNIVFDIFVTESLLPLVNGLTIYFANDEQVFSQQKLSELFSNSKIEVMQTTPTKMRSYILDKSNVKYLSQLKALILGGEALPADLYEELRKYTSAEIFNIYGPAETTVWSTNKLVESTDITIGKPIANTQVYILNQDRKPLPIGVAGELCISGDGVGAGYLNRPELTAEKFIPNPFIEGKIMYCTGDLARWCEDGEIEYLGRIDTQVKIRGLRIELGEIESVMSTFAGIQLSAVTDKRDENGRQYLVGYYTADTEIDEKALRAHLAEKLPKYMIPNYLMQLDKMPMTASGKTDRKNLPVPQMTASTSELVAPQNELEIELYKIVTEILETDQIGVTDDFFDFGGDSLRAIEYVAKAHNKGIEFTLQSVFDYPTIRELCGFIENGEARKVVYSSEDFAKFNEILSGNVIDESFAPVKRSLENVLLTGATGFLGAHILDNLMKNENGKIYCLVRSQKQDDRRGRLCEILNYYFGNTYDNEIGKRIIPIIGDVEQIGLSDNIPYDVQTVIHTAATVKHYGSYDYFRNVNVIGTENVIAYAKMCKARLIHISTISISGNSMADEIEVYRSAKEKNFDETSLYIEQPLENVYIHSKFEAEIAVLNAVLDGLDAKIIRVGNLTNRQSDYKFQPNYRENAFLTRVKAGLELGLFPDYLLPLYSEFSPIDATADGVVKIAQYADKQNVFHLNSNKPIYFDKLLEVLHELNIRMETVSGKEFNDTLQKLAKADNTEYIYEAFQNDMDENGQLVYDSNIRIKNEFTVWFLKKVGFEWKQIDFDYIKGYFEYFRNLGYLEV